MEKKEVKITVFESEMQTQKHSKNTAKAKMAISKERIRKHFKKKKKKKKILVRIVPFKAKDKLIA